MRLLSLLLLPLVLDTSVTAAERARPRVVVSTDIGGTDFDDFQSVVHLLLYTDSIDLEGLIASPVGVAPDRRGLLLKLVDLYARDYPNLHAHSPGYPEPDALRAVCKQGSDAAAGWTGFGTATEGSDWIIRCAKRDDPRPLWVLVWGGLEDLAQALHDDPSIEPKLRVYWIGGPNKKWSTTAYAYLAREHRKLWMIEANSTYRGWFVGGDQSGELGNEAFIRTHAQGHGALGSYFAEIAPQMKMGDSPALLYVLGPDPGNPGAENWGGRFVRAWDRPQVTFTSAPTPEVRVETFSLVELVYPARRVETTDTRAAMVVDRQEFPGFRLEDGRWHFLFSPKEAKTWTYRIASDDPDLDGKSGGFTSADPAPERASQPSQAYPHWWTDDSSPETAEGRHQGARTVSVHRREFLDDFAERLRRCRPE